MNACLNGMAVVACMSGVVVCTQVNIKPLVLNPPEPGGERLRRRRNTAIEAPKLNLLQAPPGVSPSNSNSSTVGTPMKRSLSDTDDNEVIAKIREAQQKQWGKMSLYFGCRRSDLDYIYKDELMRAKVSGALTHLHVAFSRELKKPKVHQLGTSARCNSSSTHCT